MRVGAELRGEPAKDARAFGRATVKAARQAVRVETRRLRDEMRAEIVRGGLGRRLPRSIRSKVYVNERGAAGVVSTTAWHILETFEKGLTIRPTSGTRYLAIPTGFNRRRGQRGGRTIYQPHELQDKFVRRSRDGSLILFARVQRAQRKTRSGRVWDQAYVESHRLGSGRKKRSERILGYGVVPMFVLKPSVRIRKRIDLERLERQAFGRLPETIDRLLNAA